MTHPSPRPSNTMTLPDLLKKWFQIHGIHPTEDTLHDLNMMVEAHFRDKRREIVKYTVHVDSCDILEGKNSECSCGLVEALGENFSSTSSG